MEDAKGILTAFSERNSKYGEFKKKELGAHFYSWIEGFNAEL